MLKIYSIYPRSFIYRHFLSLINDTSILNNFTHITKRKDESIPSRNFISKKKNNPLSWPRFTITFRASSIFEIRNTKGEAEGVHTEARKRYIWFWKIQKRAGKFRTNKLSMVFDGSAARIGSQLLQTGG